MPANLKPVERVLRGEFRVDSVGGDGWRIENLRAPHELLWLRGVGAQAAALPPRADHLTVVWRADGRVALGLRAGETAVATDASSALLHEPRAELYESLPLPAYTPERARFWRRVFRLVRIPGGRLLLGWLARRSRRPA
jgi:hypothetical protein